MAGAGFALPLKWSPRRIYGFSQSPPGIRKFITALPGLGPTAANEIGQYIPVASPDTTTFPGVDHYKIAMAAFSEQMHPDLLNPTRFWGYSDAKTNDRKYLGGLIVAKKNRPVLITAANNLPSVHPLPVDTTIMGAEANQPQNRTTVHLHGGLVPWTTDGGPFSWFTPAGGPHGASFLNPGPQPGTANYYYPNSQSARLVWYHDHALGITRLNAYAGLASGYIIRDDIEQVLIHTGAIPSREVALIIQDKIFFDPSQDPAYPVSGAREGDLWYPYLYDRWDEGPGFNSQLSPSVVPEFFADTILVNGGVYPYLPVEPRRYRFRILNGSQARFYNLQLYYADSSGTEADLSKPGPAFIQFGTEAGFLPQPVVLNNPPIPTPLVDVQTANPDGPFNLMLAPAERADLIIDFSKVPVGSKLVLYNDAPAPFPGGDAQNDYITLTTGPNTRTLMQFRVIPRVGPADPLDFRGTLLALKAALLPFAFDRLSPESAVRVRDLTLNEDFDEHGRLLQRLGTTTQNGLNNEGNPTWGRNYADTPTEVVKKGTVEVWRIFNLTADTHPIHFHLVNVQVLWRAPFTFDPSNPDFHTIGPHTAPEPNERGWKETVRMNPGEVTAVIMKFDLPDVPFAVPTSPRLQSAYGIKGFEYVWHCHILEHEEHDMMRVLVVKP
jgi:spore coat protein A